MLPALITTTQQRISTMTASEKDKATVQAETTGEQERDNDAQRPDGSGGTSHDSTAQKEAREKGEHGA
jgi:hypothetical protein